MSVLTITLLLGALGLGREYVKNFVAAGFVPSLPTLAVCEFRFTITNAQFWGQSLCDVWRSQRSRGDQSRSRVARVYLFSHIASLTYALILIHGR